MEGWLASTSKIIPLKHPKKNSPATLCQDSLILGCTQSTFPSKIPSFGKYRQLQSDHPGIFEEEKPTSPLESPRALPILYIFYLIILCTLEVFNLSANPILDSLPLPPATSSYGPSLFLPRDLIRSLCITSSQSKHNG